jgi:N6-L-threonylcarbamoyladenine synthase
LALFLGFDTSNYTTSVALYDDETGRLQPCGRLLPVEKGQRGLRQSDALFHHVKQLPTLLEQLPKGEKISAVGVSTRPRDVEGSYMPCFLVGVAAASAAAFAANAPLYEFSHQAGHMAAAALGADRLSLLDGPFLAWHLSGGTTELLHVSPWEGEVPLRVTVLGGTTDLSAGQVIDRAGVALGFSFPAGPEMDGLALSYPNPEVAPLWTKGGQLSFSGLENKVSEKIDKGEGAEAIAAFVMASVTRSVLRVTQWARKQFPNLPLLCSGGVASSRFLQRALPNAIFSPPKFSADNAIGTAVLTARRFREEASKQR